MILEVSREKVQYEKVEYRKEVLSEYRSMVEGMFRALFREFETLEVPFKGPHQVVSRALHCFEQLGKSGFMVYVTEGVLPQLKEKAKFLAESLHEDPAKLAHAEKLQEILRGMELVWRETCSDLGEKLAQVPEVSYKFEALLALVRRLFVAGSTERSAVGDACEPGEFKGVVAPSFSGETRRAVVV